MEKKRTEDLIEGNIGLDGIGEWSEMVRSFVEEG